MGSEDIANNLLQCCLQNYNNTVKIIPITIDENNIYEGAEKILKVIRPSWNHNDIRFKLFTDGITNKLVGCFYSNQQSEEEYSNATTSANDQLKQQHQQQHHRQHQQHHEHHGQQVNLFEEVILIRVYGNKTDLLIDRKVERKNILLLHSCGFAPSLYGTFNNGLAYEYVPGVTLSPETVCDLKIWPLIAKNMAEIHKIKKYDYHLLYTNNENNNINNNNNEYEMITENNMDAKHKPQQQLITGDNSNSNDIVPLLWNKIQQFLNLIPDKFSNPILHERLSKTFPNVQQLRDEFLQLFKQLEKLNSPIVFCHNDLLLGNVIYNETENKVTFIDYEYAGYNYQAFDIGNHFTEFAGIDEIDYKRYPSKEFQLKWLRVYLETFNADNNHKNINDNNNKQYGKNSKISDYDIERLYIQVNQFALAAHFFWAIWALIQCEYSKIDFDFVKFAENRYNEYLAKKDLFLSLNLHSKN